MPKGTMVLDKRIEAKASTKIPIRYRIVHNEKEIETIDEHNKMVQASHGMDVSLSGLRLVTKEVLKTGNFLRLHITLPSKFVFISTLARVVGTGKNGADIHFIAMKDDDVQALKEYIHKAG